MTGIKIDRLKIRLRGISPQVARSLAEGLGHELLGQLARQQGLLKAKRTNNISKIDSGAFQASRDTSPSDLRRIIAGRIVGAIESKAK